MIFAIAFCPSVVYSGFSQHDSVNGAMRRSCNVAQTPEEFQIKIEGFLRSAIFKPTVGQGRSTCKRHGVNNPSNGLEVFNVRYRYGIGLRFNANLLREFCLKRADLFLCRKIFIGLVVLLCRLYRFALR